MARNYTDRYGRTRRLRAEGIIPARVYDAGEEHSRRLAHEVVAEIKRQAPVRQPVYKGKRGPKVETEAGDLRTSFDVHETPRGTAITSSASYWQFVEFGTAEHGPEQAFVRRSIEVVRARHRQLGRSSR